MSECFNVLNNFGLVVDCLQYAISLVDNILQLQTFSNCEHSWWNGEKNMNLFPETLGPGSKLLILNMMSRKWARRPNSWISQFLKCKYSDMKRVMVGEDWRLLNFLCDLLKYSRYPRKINVISSRSTKLTLSSYSVRGKKLSNIYQYHLSLWVDHLSKY